MHPQLAKTYRPGKLTFPCFVQPKLDGVRALYQNATFQSRDEKLWKPKVLEHLLDQMHTLSDALEDAVVDGELYVHGWKLNRINGAVATNRSAPSPDTPFISYHIFDIVWPKRGFEQKFSSRFLGLYNWLQELRLPNVHPVPTAFIYLQEEVQYHFDQYVGAGYEGIMLRPDGPYVPGKHLSNRTHTVTEKRSDYLWKHKAWEDDEFICTGTKPGEGKAAIGIGALTFTLLDGTTFDVGSGFDDYERAFFAQNPPIGKKCKIRYASRTAYGKPFHPRFVSVEE